MRRLTAIAFLSAALISSNVPADSEMVKLAWNETSDPLVYAEDGAVRGILPELLQAIVVDQMGLRLHNAAYPWARAQQLVSSGRRDAMVTNATPARREYAYASSEVLYTARVVPLVKRSSEAARTLVEDPTVQTLRELRLCHSKASGWHRAFADRNELKTFGVKNSEVCARMIHRGRMDVAVYAEDMLLWDVRRLGIQDDVRIIDVEFGVWQLKLMLAKKSSLGQTFLTAFDQTVAAMKADGRFDALLSDIRRRYR